MAQLVQRLKNKFRPPLPIFKLVNRAKPKFECPICHYFGPFKDLSSFAGARKHAKCPSCGALERHRMQYLVLAEIFEKLNPSRMRMLHFAPEPFFTKIF